MDRICPLLGLVSDRRTVIDGVDGAHRCHATGEALSPDRQLQSQLCLTANHDRCERFRAYVTRTGLEHPGRPALADGMVTTRFVLAPEPAWRGIAGRARRRRGAFAAVGAGVITIGLGGAAVASAMGGEIDLARLLGPGSTLTPNPVPTTPGSPRPTRTATPTAVETVAPSVPSPAPPSSAPTATPAPTPQPTAQPTPVPTPAPVTTYTVAAGDTLALIAQRFGTTVAALQALNAIEDPNEIVVGQVLVVP